MTVTDIVDRRVHSQHINGNIISTAKDVVAWMGAVQAQDYAMAKWAVGVRLPQSTDQSVEHAIHTGEVIRTHVLRPTWHFVSSDDIAWMLAMTAPRIQASMRSRNKQLELTDTILKKTNTLIEKALSGGRHLTRDELVAKLRKAGIATDEYRSGHILLEAELNGIACSGPVKNNMPTYTLLSERVKKTQSLTRDEALAKLAAVYFSSHGPATLQDFAWWSGVSAADARKAGEMIRTEFIAERIGSNTFWLSASTLPRKPTSPSVHLLPAYDEYLISYKDRSASFQLTDDKKTVSNNGVFRPVIIVDGQVTGLWQRTMKTDSVIIRTEMFHSPDNPTRIKIEQRARAYAKFLGKELRIVSSREA